MPEQQSQNQNQSQSLAESVSRSLGFLLGNIVGRLYNIGKTAVESFSAVPEKATQELKSAMEKEQPAEAVKETALLPLRFGWEGFKATAKSVLQEAVEFERFITSSLLRAGTSIAQSLDLGHPEEVPEEWKTKGKTFFELYEMAIKEIVPEKYIQQDSLLSKYGIPIAAFGLSLITPDTLETIRGIKLTKAFVNSAKELRPVLGALPFAQKVFPKASKELEEIIRAKGLAKALTTTLQHRITFDPDSIKSLIKELAEKEIIKIKPEEATRVSVQTIRNILDNSTSDELWETMFKYGTSPEKLSQELIKSATIAGKTLNIFSQLKRYGIVVSDELGTLKLEEVPIPWIVKFKEAYKILDAHRKAFLVGQLSTAMRNAQTQTLRGLLDVADEGIIALGKIVFGRKPVREAIAPLMHRAFAVKNAFNRKNVKLFDELAEKYPLQATRLSNTIVGDIALGDDMRKVVTIFNQTQELLQRKIFFEAKLRDEVFKLTGKSLDDFQNLDKLDRFIRNLTKNKTRLEDLIETATDYALTMTFAAQPKYAFGRAILKTFNDFPFLTALLTPFPRWTAAKLEFMYDYSPMGVLRFFNKKIWQDLARGDEQAWRTLAQVINGTILWSAAWAIRNSPKLAGVKWYEVNKGTWTDKDGKIQQKTLDLRAYDPFASYLALAEILKDPSKIGSEDFNDMIASISGLSRFGLEYVPILSSLVDKYGPENFIDRLKATLPRIAGEYVSGFTVPLRTFKDFLAQLDEEEAKIRTVRTSPFWGPILRNVPLGSQLLPVAQRPIREQADLIDEAPAIKQLTGLRTYTKSYLESEAERLFGNDVWQLYSWKTGIPDLELLFQREMADILEKKLGVSFVLFHSKEYYQDLTDAEKKEKIKKIFSELRSVVKLREIVQQKAQDIIPILRKNANDSLRQRAVMNFIIENYENFPEEVRPEVEDILFGIWNNNPDLYEEFKAKLLQK